MTKAIHPITGKLEHCYMLDDYFGHHKYGVQFMANGQVWREDEITFPKELTTPTVISTGPLEDIHGAISIQELAVQQSVPEVVYNLAAMRFDPSEVDSANMFNWS